MRHVAAFEPQIMASASPRRTASAAITVALVRTMVRAASGRDAAAAGGLDIGLHIFAVARIVLRIDQREVAGRP